jgi:hypothetical protein
MGSSLFFRIVKITICGIALVAFSTSLLAETILLKNGTSLKGKVINQDEGMIEFESDLEIFRFRKEDIYKVIYKDITEEEERELFEEEERKETIIRAKNSRIEPEQAHAIDYESIYQEMSQNSNKYYYESLMSPGRGQYLQGEETKGLVMGTGFYLSGFLTIYYLGKFAQSYKSFLDYSQDKNSNLLYGIGNPTLALGLVVADQNEFSNRQKEYKEYALRRSQFAILTIAFYIWNIYDAKQIRKYKPSTSWNIEIGSEPLPMAAMGSKKISNSSLDGKSQIGLDLRVLYSVRF